MWVIFCPKIDDNSIIFSTVFYLSDIQSKLIWSTFKPQAEFTKVDNPVEDEEENAEDEVGE